MRVKLDENLPPRAAGPLVAAGHDVDTVADEGLAGRDDATVSDAATSDGRLVVTLDRGFGDLRRYPPGTHAGILVLRLEDQSSGAVTAAIEQLLLSLTIEDLTGCVAVYRHGDLRIRRPT